MISSEYNDAELMAALARIKTHVTDMSDLMVNLGDLLIESTKQRFLDGTAPDGSVWAPKSPATLDAYRQREKSEPDFRPLFGSTKWLSSEIFSQSTTNTTEIGSSLIYAAVQQFGASKGEFGTASNGSSVPWGDIPARPFIGLSDQDRTDVGAEIEEYLERIAKG